MKFRLYTLVDITETGEHRGNDLKRTSQQSNYNTVIQTLNLRSNIIPLKLSNYMLNLDNANFGTNYSGNNMIWSFIFDIDYGVHSIEYMIEDFTLVPIVSGLDETAVLNKSMFQTYDKKYKNIIFEELAYA